MFLRALQRDERGAVAPMFAIALLPLVGLAGVGIDYGRAATARQQMQNSLDASALWLSKKAGTQSADSLQTDAVTLFNAQFKNADTKNVAITATYTAAGGSTLTLSARGDVDAYITGIIGVPILKIATASTVKWGSKRLRVALVLDTTGSMTSAGKMSALKTATKDLLTQLQNASPTSGDVYVSIIPFSKNVDIGSSNVNASYIDWADWEDEPKIIKSSKPDGWSSIGPGSSCPFTNSSHGFRCTTTPANAAGDTSTIPSSGSYAGYICPSVDSGGRDATKIGIYYNGCYNSVPSTSTSTRTLCTGSSCSCGSTQNCACTGSGWNKKCTVTTTTTGAPYTHNWVKNPRSTWNGCVTDRGTSTGPSNDFDRKITAPMTSAESRYPAEQNSYCPPELKGLSYNWSAMRVAVDNLYPVGATNQPIGLVWGWQSLAGGGPLSAPAKDTSYTYDDVIVLMSDGLNTLNRWYGNGSSTNTSVDNRMYQTSVAGTCANIKAAGITIYTIHVNTDGDPQSTLLKNCASTPDKFWMVTTASGISTVFNQIGTQLSKLRIAK
jgi:Flp pilus assembly protein TadG